jgi:hypothetical protein
VTNYDLRPQINIKGCANGFSSYVAIAKELTAEIIKENKKNIV